MNRPIRVFAAFVVLALGLSSCATAATLEGRAEGEDAPIIVGSQDYYSNEILAEAYAQALENAGYEVDRQYRIGQREVYVPELESGSIDVFPEYTGSLLQYFAPDAEATLPEDVLAALVEALPEGLGVLTPAQASDQDSYVVTAAFARAHGLRSIADLAGAAAKTGGLTLGGNSELETRPYGPKGLREVYGVEVAFTPIEDSGGALSVKALKNDQVQLIDVYSADPALSDPELRVLDDPEGMFLSSRVVPVVSPRVDAGAVEALNAVSAALDSADLIEMNRRSTEEAASAQVIAREWLVSEGLLTARG